MILAQNDTKVSQACFIMCYTVPCCKYLFHFGIPVIGEPCFEITVIVVLLEFLEQRLKKLYTFTTFFSYLLCFFSTERMVINPFAARVSKF